MGAGERQSSGTCKYCFQYLIPAYQLPVYPMIAQLWQFTSTLTSIIISAFARAEYNKYVDHVKPSKAFEKSDVR